MFGPIAAIVAFFVSLALSFFICKTGDECKQLNWGISATVGLIVFLALIMFLKSHF
jgi:tetrahydromethanopterin S-methyltransferase subunit E